MKLHTYLNFGGKCREALTFYEKHLGGRITSMSTFADMPPQPQGAQGQPQMPRDGILHARIVIGDAEIMASDVPPNLYQPMRSVYLSLSVDTNEEAESIYKTLSAGGETFMPMQETFFAHRFAMLRDKFGTSWMVIHQKVMAAV
jgi:PhnB protein